MYPIGFMEKSVSIKETSSGFQILFVKQKEDGIPGLPNELSSLKQAPEIGTLFT